MIWIVITSGIAALLSIYFGYLKIIHLQNLKRKSLLYFLFACTLIITVLRILHINDLFPEEIAGASMTAFYSSIGGFLLGGSLSNYLKKRAFGNILYRNRNFATDILPMLIGVALILMGIYRTSVFSDLPITPIRLTSGLSIFMLGLWGFTIQTVPEFRESGFILIDRFITWDNFVSYEWFDEETLSLEYELDGHIQVFGTNIPPEDQLEIEKILNEKLIEKNELGTLV